MTGEDFSDWRTNDGAEHQRTLRARPIGTAFNSIDRPISNA